MGTGQNTTHMLYVRPCMEIYMTNVGSDVVSQTCQVIVQVQVQVQVQLTVPPTGMLPASAESNVDRRQAIIQVGQGAKDLDVMARGRRLWTATPAGTLSVVDVETGQV